MNREQFSFLLSVVDILESMSNFSLDVRSFIAAQFALESDYGTSDLAISNYNFCGMKNPLVRISCAKHAGDSQYHWAQYNTLAHCVYDYILCLQYHRPMSVDYDTPKHLGRFLSKFYCSEKDYIDKINSIYVQFKKFKNERH